jgi:hypothetical protein
MIGNVIFGRLNLNHEIDVTLVLSNNCREVLKLKADPSVWPNNLVCIVGKESNPRRVSLDGDDLEIEILLWILHKELLRVLMKLNSCAKIDKFGVENLFEITHFCGCKGPIALGFKYPICH